MDENNFKGSCAKFTVGFITALRRAAFYPVTHPSVISAVQNVYSELFEILKEKNTLVLDITADNRVLVDGEALEENGAFLKQNIFFFKKLNIENITFVFGLTLEELNAFMGILLLNAGQAKALGDLKKAFLDRNIWNIRVNQFSYVKIIKGEESLVQKVKLSEMDELKDKIEALIGGKVALPQDAEAIEKELFEMVIGELQGKKGISVATKNILKKFIAQRLKPGESPSKLKDNFLKIGRTPEEADNFAQKIEKELSPGPEKEKKSLKQQLKELIKENEELKSKVLRFEQELSKNPPLQSADIIQGEIKAGASGEGEVVKKEIKALREEKESIDSIIHHITEGVVVVDRQGKILMINPPAEIILGTSITEAVGRQIREVIKEEHLLTLLKKIRADEQGDSQKDIELYSVNPLTMQTLKSSSAVIEDPNGRTIGLLSVLNDVAKQKELDRMKLDFFSKVTHELRSPLIAMDKSLSLVLSKVAGALSPEQENFIGIVERNAKRLTLLINDLLDISKFEAGKIQLLREEVAIEKVVSEPVAVFEAWAGAKNIKIEKKIQPGLPLVNLDPNRIIQVMNNLISNSLKFTPEGGVLYIEALLRENKELELSVKDTGVGIPSEELSKVFEKFYQVRSTSQHNDIRGTGIGLTVAKEIVELHGGKIWAESEVGFGTRFVFTLPVSPET